MQNDEDYPVIHIEEDTLKDEIDALIHSATKAQEKTIIESQVVPQNIPVAEKSVPIYEKKDITKESIPIEYKNINWLFPWCSEEEEVVEEEGVVEEEEVIEEKPEVESVEEGVIEGDIISKTHPDIRVGIYDNYFIYMERNPMAGLSGSKIYNLELWKSEGDRDENTHIATFPSPSETWTSFRLQTNPLQPGMYSFIFTEESGEGVDFDISYYYIFMIDDSLHANLAKKMPISSPVFSIKKHETVYDFLDEYNKSFVQWVETIDTNTKETPTWIDIFKGKASIQTKLKYLKTNKYTLFVPTEEAIQTITSATELKSEQLLSMFLYHISPGHVDLQEKGEKMKEIESLLEGYSKPEIVKMQRSKDPTSNNPLLLLNEDLFADPNFQRTIQECLIQPIQGVLLPISYIENKIKKVELELKSLEKLQQQKQKVTKKLPLHIHFQPHPAKDTTKPSSLVGIKANKKGEDVSSFTKGLEELVRNLKLNNESPSSEKGPSSTDSKFLTHCIPSTKTTRNVFPEEGLHFLHSRIQETLDPRKLLASALGSPKNPITV